MAGVGRSRVDVETAAQLEAALKTSDVIVWASARGYGALARQPETPVQQQISDREMEVLDCLALGQTTSQIASKLFISENTVKTHVRHILEKLEASNRTEAVGKAIQLGIIQKRGA